jgi:transcriptional regulator with XRE-family HTH domain
MPQQPRTLDADASPLAAFGARLRAYRTRSGWSQAELGRLVHVSGTLIAKMERAERRPQPDVTARLDQGLQADGELVRLAADALRAPEFGSDRFHGRREGLDAAWAPAIEELRRLATLYDTPEDGPTRPSSELAASAYQLTTWRLNCNYRALAQALPHLIPELTRSLLIEDARQRGQAARHLVQAWRAADAIAAKLGLFDLSTRLIHVMVWAAGQADDDLVTAATAYVRGETFLANGQLGTGLAMLERAAGRVQAGPPSTGRSAQCGSLHMRAGLTAARAGLRDEAYAHLAEARSRAASMRDGVWEGTAFGPASVRIHQACAAIDLGTPDRALEVASGWAPPLTLPAERRSQFSIDVARAQLAVGDHESALRALNAALEIAPENVRVHPHVRQTLAGLAAAGRSNLSGVEGFARAAAITVSRDDE